MTKLATILMTLIATVGCTLAIADPTAAQLKLNIKDAVSSNAYYLCIYGSGCYNIKELNGKSIPVMPDDFSNDTKMAVLNSNQFQMSTQPNTTSCEVNDAAGKTVTISGNLVVSHGVATIKDLNCHAA